MNDQQKFQTEYDAFGNIQTPIPANSSPASNPGLVSDPGNLPTAPSSFGGGNTKNNLNFFAKGGGVVGIGTYVAQGSTATEKGEASIIIYDRNGDILFLASDSSLSGFTLDLHGNPIALFASSLQGRDTPIDLVGIFDSSAQNDGALAITVDNQSTALFIEVDGDGGGINVTGDGTETNNQVTIANTNPANLNSPVQVGNNALISSHFLKMLNLQGIHVYISDGTNPNGVVTAEKGAVCLNTSATGQIAYNTIAGSNVWVQI